MAFARATVARLITSGQTIFMRRHPGDPYIITSTTRDYSLSIKFYNIFRTYSYLFLCTKEKIKHLFSGFKVNTLGLYYLASCAQMSKIYCA